jgi:hypothetical protein
MNTPAPEPTGRQQAARFVLRDMPGVMELEALLQGDAPRNWLWDPEREKASALCERVTRELFGLRDDDLDESFVEGAEENLEAMAALATVLGWDLTDGAGERLECFGWLAPALVYAARGFGGHLPDPDRTASVVSWEHRIRAEAEAFRAAKRKGGL